MPRVIKKLSTEDLDYWRFAMPKLGEIRAGVGEDLLAHIDYLKAALDQAEAEAECRGIDVNRALASNERLREALGESEYSARNKDGDWYCGVCGQHQGFGHTDNCVVGQALDKTEDEKP